MMVHAKQIRQARIGLSAGLLGAAIVVIVVLGTEIKSSQDAAKFAELQRDMALRRAKLIIESSDQVMVVCDESGIITESNKAASDVLGWSNSELVGNPSSILVPDAYKAQHSAGMERARNRLRKFEGDWLLTSDRRTLKALHKDGSELEAIASVRAIKDGDRIDFVLSLSPAVKPPDAPLILKDAEKLSDVEEDICKKNCEYAQLVKQRAE